MNYFNIENTPQGVAVTTSAPKKSKALVKNIEKLKNFFKVLIEEHKNPEKRTIESLEQTIERLNAKKVAIIEAAEIKEEKIMDKYVDDLTKSKGHLDTAVAKETRNIKLNRLNEETETKLDSIDEKIDDIQTVIDERKEEMEFQLQQQVLEQQLKDDVARMTAPTVQSVKTVSPVTPVQSLEPIPEKHVEYTDDWTEKDQKNLDSFRRYVQATSGKKEKSDAEVKPAEPILEPIEVQSSIDIQPEPINTTDKAEQMPSYESLSDNKLINNLSNEFDKKINVRGESTKTISETRKLEIETADQVAAIKKELDNGISDLLTDAIVKISKIYRQQLETNIESFTKKTEKIINQAGAEVEKEKAEKEQIAKDRDQYKSHYEQATQMVQDRDTTIASKDAEIKQLREQLRQAEIAKDVAEKAREVAETELSYSEMKVERYKNVVDAFASQGTMTPVPPVTSVETMEVGGKKM